MVSVLSVIVVLPLRLGITIITRVACYHFYDLQMFCVSACRMACHQQEHTRLMSKHLYVGDKLTFAVCRLDDRLSHSLCGVCTTC